MFKKIIFTILLLATSLLASEIKWAKDFESGIKDAKAQNKPVLFVFSRHTCKYCVILEQTTFKDDRVIKALDRDFVSIVSYTDENDYTPRELWRPGTPSIWFLRPDGEPMFQPIMGAVDADNFLKALAIVKDEFDKGLGK
jgi:thioredoxin-related protein